MKGNIYSASLTLRAITWSCSAVHFSMVVCALYIQYMCIHSLGCRKKIHIVHTAGVRVFSESSVYVASFMNVQTYTEFILCGLILLWFHIYEYDLVERE